MRLIGIPEACRLLGIGRCHIYKLMGEGVLKSLKLGNRRLIILRTANELMERLEQ